MRAPASLLAALAGLALLAALAPTSTAQAPCDNFWVDPAGPFEVPNADQGLDFVLHAPAGCTYALDASVSWLDVSDERLSMASNEASFSITVWSNELGYARAGRVSLRGPNDVQFIDIRQTGDCTQSVSQSTFYYDKDRHGGSFLVTTGSSCAWSATSGDAWISVGSGEQRGTQTVFFSIEANPGTEGRVGRIDVGTASVIVTQAATAGGTVPDPPALGGGGNQGGGHNSSEDFFGLSDEDLAEMPGLPAALVLAALGLLALVRGRR